jgi:hypothetical protein
MKGVLMLLKSIGVEITPEQIALLQQYIPQIPALCNGAAQAINNSIKMFDERLKAIETEQHAQRLLLEELNGTTQQPAGDTGSSRYTDPRRARRNLNGADTGKPGDGGTA